VKNSKSSSAGTLTSQIVTQLRHTDRVGATPAVRTNAEALAYRRIVPGRNAPLMGA
jgi:hypothetical protein